MTEQPWQQLFKSAQRAVEKQQWLTAEPLLRQTIEHVPQHASAHHLLGKVLLAQGRGVENAWQAKDLCKLDL